ncbi:MAG TPA: LysM peptidoglycan-binding domain-containing protein [Nitrospira sp.]|nr:LysM peptidoglycan-binding domain-containing protein [Nitrospira sp.]
MISAINASLSTGLLWRAVCGCSLALVLGSLAACGELEPMIEPEVADLQLTVDTLKTQVRDAQRVIAELRSELEARRQELADGHVMRAQLEGRVREAERRVAEARHVIDLQREELLAARTERERLSKTSLQLQSQIQQLQKHLAKLRSTQDGGPAAAPAFYETPGGRAKKAGVSLPSFPELEPTGKRGPAAAGTARTPSDGAMLPERQVQGTPVRAISVKPGDTLWSIAQRYHVDVRQLRALNHMTDNRIAVGQAIWVPALGAPVSGSAETNR